MKEYFTEIFKVLTAVLLLGNLTFDDSTYGNSN
jgi:myosin heavy subunit